jgi:hypothetical protein
LLSAYQGIENFTLEFTAVVVFHIGGTAGAAIL